jgi:rhodanese-related sulfurtransferase
MGGDMADGIAEPFKRITVDEARALIDQGGLKIIDVREPSEYAAGHIPGAELIPLAKVMANPSVVNYDDVIFVCEAGARSAVAAEFAASLGKQNLYNLEGGTGAWRKQGLPIDK